MTSKKITMGVLETYYERLGERPGDTEVYDRVPFIARLLMLELEDGGIRPTTARAIELAKLVYDADWEDWTGEYATRRTFFEYELWRRGDDGRPSKDL